MLFAAKRNDISDVVIRSIERAGRRVEAANKKEQRQIEESEDPLDGPITVEEKERVEEKQERQEELEAKKTEREQMVAERQRQRDSIRDAKKAEFEARRQRLIEERERRKDSVMNARQNRNNPPEGGE